MAKRARYAPPSWALQESEDDQNDQAIYPWHIKADGGQAFPQPANGRDFCLKELQGFVGGSIELIRVPKYADSRFKLIMVVNEAGRLQHLPLNTNASLIVGMPVVGDVLVCHARQVK